MSYFHSIHNLYNKQLTTKAQFVIHAFPLHINSPRRATTKDQLLSLKTSVHKRNAKNKMLNEEETAKLISLVKEQPLLYANLDFNTVIDQQIEVLKLGTWENISKAMNMEPPLVIEQWNEIEERFNDDLKTCTKTTDFYRNCYQFNELQFLIRHYQQKNMFLSECFEQSECEFVITEEDLKQSDQEYDCLFQELPEPENQEREIDSFLESFGINEGEQNDILLNEEETVNHITQGILLQERNFEDATDEEFGEFLLKQLKTMTSETEKRAIKRDILKML
ncbi:hypothetical protein ACFFRR_003042 [Megaselia abdita]